ncbi:sigma-70 family RNA polymerase sigma factor [Cohnella yongneupensis]|uniref:Sigma-70 family RNA polymerase sigma factor n=1 Tax=Cohnella yongneupensis TaxID=425006 RepID=A0ABW0R390_9BACL
MVIIEWVKRAQQGDETAFLALFQQYEEDLYRVAYVYLGNQEDALDVVQETAYRSYKAINRLKEPQYFKTWLIKIAIRCSMDVFRKRKQEVRWKPEYNEAITVGDEGDFKLSLTLNEMIEALDIAEKQVIILRFYYDFTIRETAEIMDIPLGTGKTLLYRALRKLRERAGEGVEYGFR